MYLSQANSMEVDKKFRCYISFSPSRCIGWPAHLCKCLYEEHKILTGLLVQGPASCISIFLCLQLLLSPIKDTDFMPRFLLKGLVHSPHICTYFPGPSRFENRRTRLVCFRVMETERCAPSITRVKITIGTSSRYNLSLRAVGGELDRAYTEMVDVIGVSPLALIEPFQN